MTLCGIAATSDVTYRNLPDASYIAALVRATGTTAAALIAEAGAMTRISGAIGDVSDTALTAWIGLRHPACAARSFAYPRSTFTFDLRGDATGRVHTNFDRRVWCPPPRRDAMGRADDLSCDIERPDDSGDGSAGRPPGNRSTS